MSDALRITGNGRTLVPPSIPGFQITGYKNSSNLADVWSALQLSLDRNVEIWVLKSELAKDTAMAANYEEIARSISRIKHSNFVQIIDISRTPEDIPFTVFEEIDGVSLTTELERSGKMDQKKAAGIVMEIARVLDSAWKQFGLVHRNIKPDTVFLARGTGVKITNFNSATLIKAGRDPLAFDEGMIIGTPNYQSPEQIECSRTIDFHADMYSTGALFYEMITGEAPFGDEEDPLIVMDLQRAGTLPNPREADKSIKPGFVYVMQKMMAKDAKDRYTWWQDVIEDLQRVLDGRPPYPQDGGTYAPPHSTIGIMQGDVSPETATPRSIPVQSGQKKVAAMRTSSQAVSDRMKLRPRGTGCLAQIGAFIFIVAALCLTVIFTVKRPVAKDSRPEEIEEVEEYTEADVGETIGYDNLDYTTVQETPQAKTDETQSEEMPEVKAAPPALKEAVADIYRIFMDKKFVEAKAFAQKRLLQARDSGACDKDQCEAIAGAFENAALYVDIVGDSLMQSSATREISIGGNIFKLASKMYANGFIVGTITGADGVTRENFNIDLSKMTPSEMFYIMESGVTPTDTQSLLALAFLSLKAKEPLYFKNIVDHHNLEGLKPFIELSREE